MKNQNVSYYNQQEANRFKASATVIAEKINIWIAETKEATGLEITLEDVFKKDFLKNRVMELAQKDAEKLSFPASQNQVIANAEKLMNDLQAKLHQCYVGYHISLFTLFESGHIRLNNSRIEFSNLDKWLMQKFTLTPDELGTELNKLAEQAATAINLYNDYCKANLLDCTMKIDPKFQLFKTHYNGNTHECKQPYSIDVRTLCITSFESKRNAKLMQIEKAKAGSKS